MHTNLSQALLEALRARGATEVFGIPGDFALPFFDVLERSRVLPYFTLSHEPAVGFAADAAARLRGGLGVAAVTYGAGALNLVNAVAGAYAEKSAVVVISGAPGTHERGGGLLLHHQAKSLGSQRRIFEEVTCAQTVLDDPARAPAEIVRVLDAALDCSRPVYIEIPRDMAGTPVGPLPASTSVAVDAAAVAACADEVLARLRGAERPVLLAGVEVRRYGLEAKAARLATRLGLPVVTSFLGRGLLTSCGCPPLGTYLGAAGDSGIRELVEGSDALLLLGAILCDTNFGVSTRRVDGRTAILACDGQVRLAYHCYANIDLGALLDALLERAEPLARAPAPRRSKPARPESDPEADVTPDDVSAAVDRLFQRRGRLPLAADTGDALFLAMDIGETELVAPGYYAGMGFAVPAALGLQAATGRRPLVLTGDGAFQMTGWELGHCRRYGWDPIVLVLNNRGWGMLNAFRPAAGYNDLGEWPLAELARSLGGSGVRVRSCGELSAALDAAHMRRGRFQLIEVMLQPGQTSSTLAKFVSAVSRPALA